MKELIDKLYNDNKNLIVTGNISSGKTTNILFPIVEKAIENDENLCILDSKEEYLYTYYDRLLDKGYNTIIINLREPLKSVGFNPLNYPYHLYKDSKDDRCLDILKNIGNSLFYENNNSDPFWNNSASDYFVGLALCLFDDASEEEINFNSINSLLNYKNKKIEKYIKLKDRKSKAYLSISPIVLAPGETKGGILTIAREKIKDLIIKDSLGNLLSKTTFDYNVLKKNKNAIFIIGKDEDLSLSRITPVIIEELYYILLDLKNDKKYNFVLDNIDTLENINNFKEILSSCISRNIKFLCATRSYIDLEEKYSDYIKKLCNILEINDKEIDIYKDNRIDSINYEYVNKIINKDVNLNYPILTVNEIKVFNLGLFLKDKEQDFEIKDNNNVITNYIDDNKDEIEKYNELIDRINIEINKIEKNKIEEQLDFSSSNIKTDDNKIDELNKYNELINRVSDEIERIEKNAIENNHEDNKLDNDKLGEQLENNKDEKLISDFEKYKI